MTDRKASDLVDTLRELMLIPGPSGHEGLVRHAIRRRLEALGLGVKTDRFGNLMTTLPGSDPAAPSVMLYAHMDQIGFFVRRVEANGLLRVERLGGIPDRVLPATPLMLCRQGGAGLPAVFAVKSNHVTPESEKLKGQSYLELYVDAGFADAAAAARAGVRIGTPVVYEPRSVRLDGDRISGSSIDDRAGCAVVLEGAKALAAPGSLKSTVHLVFSVQEEFNVRGAFVAAQALRPDIAIQLDIAIASDTPDVAELGEVALGRGPVISLYNFHGRGTLNGVIPHPELVRHVEMTADRTGIPLQRSAIVGVLTDNAYVQFAGEGVACLDLGIPCRYAHSPSEVADLDDMRRLAALLGAAISSMDGETSLDRDNP